MLLIPLALKSKVSLAVVVNSLAVSLREWIVFAIEVTLHEGLLPFTVRRLNAGMVVLVVLLQFL